ncbi:hypothetical protein GCM10027610_143890 [Dactylosporangium cerinum]
MVSGGRWRDKPSDFRLQVPGDPSDCTESGNDPSGPDARSGTAEVWISFLCPLVLRREWISPVLWRTNLQA